MVNTPVVFYGTDYESILLQGREFVKKLLGKLPHPDFLEFTFEGKTYVKEQITLFLSDIALSPYEAKYKVYLFPRADKMLPVHANALLKIFEEKPDHAVILLITDNIKGILETILSRSQKIFVPERTQKTYTQGKVEEAILQASKKDLYGCLDTLSEMEEIDIQEAIEIFFENHKHSLEMAHSWVNQAFIAFDRHTKPKLILEYLLLKSYLLI